MKITYFGEIADITSKTSEIILEVSTTDFLTAYLQDQYGLNKSEYHIALDHSLVGKSENVEISEQDEIAILSPFAGG